MLHQVFAILVRKESNVTHLVPKVEDLILEDENLESKPKWMILHWLSCLIIRPKPINRMSGRGDTVLRWLFSYMVVCHWSYSSASSATDVLIHVHRRSRSRLLQHRKCRHRRSKFLKLWMHYRRYQEGQSFWSSILEQLQDILVRALFRAAVILFVLA